MRMTTKRILTIMAALGVLAGAAAPQAYADTSTPESEHSTMEGEGSMTEMMAMMQQMSQMMETCNAMMQRMTQHTPDLPSDHTPSADEE